MFNDSKDCVKVIVLALLVIFAHIMGYHVPYERVGIESGQLMHVFHGLEKVVSRLSHFVLDRVGDFVR